MRYVVQRGKRRTQGHGGYINATCYTEPSIARHSLLVERNDLVGHVVPDEGGVRAVDGRGHAKGALARLAHVRQGGSPIDTI